MNVLRRRRFLSVAAVSLSLLVSVTCSHQRVSGVRIASLADLPQSPGAEGRPVGAPVIAVPAGLQDRLRSAVAAMSPAPDRGRPRVETDVANADVQVVPASEPASDLRVARRWSVATAGSRIDLDAIAIGTLAFQARAGPLYVASQYEALAAALFADASGLRPVTAEDLPSRLAHDPTALAIVPADMVTTAVHALTLDGMDPVRGVGELADYPLTTRVRIVPNSRSDDAQALGAALAGALEGLDPPPTSVIFTGDVIPTRCVYDQMRRAGDWSAPFRAVAPRLAAADIAVGSLDASISSVGEPIGCEVTFNLLAPPQVVEGFKLANFKVMTVAANHAKDCGRSQYCGDRAFLDTLANLQAAGIQPAGGGTTAADSRRPAVVQANGVRFAFLGYDDIAEYYHAGEKSPGTAGLDLSTLAGDVREALAAADVVIVMPHWGDEYTPDPTARQQRAAAIAIEAGATLVVGNHPHVVQAAGPVSNGYVAYALGNFVFDQDWSVETTQGVTLEASFRGRHLAAVRFLPIQIEARVRPIFLDSVAGAPILERMMRAEERLSP